MDHSYPIAQPTTWSHLHSTVASNQPKPTTPWNDWNSPTTSTKPTTWDDSLFTATSSTAEPTGRIWGNWFHGKTRPTGTQPAPAPTRQPDHPHGRWPWHKPTTTTPTATPADIDTPFGLGWWRQRHGENSQPAQRPKADAFGENFSKGRCPAKNVAPKILAFVSKRSSFYRKRHEYLT